MTRANIYICDQFIAEVPSDAYPGGEFWQFLLPLDGCSEKEFREKVTAKIREWEGEEYLPPKSSGIGNWSYEFCWFPTTQPESYRDWENWKGRILVREVDGGLTYRRFGSSYWRVPGPWVPIAEWEETDGGS